MSFAQTSKGKNAMKTQLDAVRSAITNIIASISIDTESSRKLKSFLQQTSASGDADDLSLKNFQPQAKMVAYESKSGTILQTIKDMQSKAEAELSDLRKKEMGETHNFKMTSSGINGEIEHNREMLASATSAKAGAQEALATAQGDLVETQKTKAADEAYSANLKTECESTAKEWADRQQSAKEEIGAIEKAKEILM